MQQLLARIACIVGLFISTPVLAKSLWIIDVHGSINPGSADYIQSHIKEMQTEDSVEGLVVRLNTPGGLLSTTRDIIQSIHESKKPVIVLVAPAGASATSAGALITLSAHYAIMQKGTNIGAAHPVGPSGETPQGAMNDKITQDTAALARAQAELRGRNRELAEKIVTQSLSFTAEEALKNKLIDATLDTEDQLLAVLTGLNKMDNKLSATEILAKPMTLKQKTLHAISDPNVSTLLMTLGGLALYTEISSGFSMGIPGIIGIFMLLLAFISLQMLSINAGAMALMIFGLALLVAEFFVTSFGLLAIGGLVSIFLGSLFLTDPTQIQWGISPSLIGGLFSSFALVIALFGFIAWRDSRKKVRFGMDALLGEKALVTELRDPHHGVIQINGELWNFVSQEPVEKNQWVIIKAFNNGSFEVKKLP